MSEKLEKELQELDLSKASGGASIDGVNFDVIMKVFEVLNIDVSKERVLFMIKQGGSTLRDFAKSKSNNNHLCNLIPIFGDEVILY